MHPAKPPFRGPVRTPWLALAALAWLGSVSCSGFGGSAPALSPGAPHYVLDTGFPKPSPITFGEVSWMTVDQETHQVYVLQRSQPPVTVWTSEGELVSAWETQELGDPHSIDLHVASDGTKSIWITDMAPPLLAGQVYGHCLKHFTLNGELLGTIGACGENSEGTGLNPIQFDMVTDVAWDSAGRLLVTDGDLNGLNNRVVKLTPAGQTLQSWSAPGGGSGSGPGEFDLPHAVVVDDCDRSWIADALNHRVQVLGPDGAFLGQWACFGEYGVYGLALGGTQSAPAGPRASLFVTTSPTTGGGKGTVYVFEAPMDCRRPREIGACVPRTSWQIELPPTSETSLLHAVAVDQSTGDLFISELGGTLPPQKWIAKRAGAGAGAAGKTRGDDDNAQ